MVTSRAALSGSIAAAGGAETVRPFGDVAAPTVTEHEPSAAGNMNSEVSSVPELTWVLTESTVVPPHRSFAALPAVNPRDLHALGDALGRSDESAFTAFVDAVRDWLSARVTAARAEPARLARFADVWDRLNRAARDVEVFHLERKPMVFNVFGWLAEASRG